MPRFERYIGIDYPGAETPTSSVPGLRMYAAEWAIPPKEVPPPSSPEHWTRRSIAKPPRDELMSPEPVLVGIDHGFSFPLGYFVAHHLPPNWPALLGDFQRHWPTDEDNTYLASLGWREVAQTLDDPALVVLLAKFC